LKKCFERGKKLLVVFRAANVDFARHPICGKIVGTSFPNIYLLFMRIYRLASGAADFVNVSEFCALAPLIVNRNWVPAARIMALLPLYSSAPI
jgi:hypothetical protein